MKSENAALRIAVQDLEKELSLFKGGKSSRSSSTAPSHDIGRSNRITLRISSGKKSGGQPGHKGHSLALSDNPCEIIEHHPHTCTHCGTDLQTVESASYTRRQEIDIPPVLPVYTEHRSCIKTCPVCQYENRGVFPARLRSPIQYGAHIEAITGYLSIYQSIPYRRICRLFKDFFGLNLSEGTIDTFLDNLAGKSRRAYESIRDRIVQSKVVGADETGCRVNGKKHWFHVWQTQMLTFIVSFASRGHAVIEKHFPDGFINSFYVSDCWASQLKVRAIAHQLCMAHLLRELTNFVENLQSEWSAKMKNLFLKAIELKSRMTQNDYRNPPAEVDELNQKLYELLMIDDTKFHPKEKAFIKRLNKHRPSIFTFLNHPDIPPDNNASERAIRNVKVKTKVSGQFRNIDGKGADRYAKIRSVIDTTNKNGQDIYYALLALANCNS
jgi:transposase